MNKFYSKAETKKVQLRPQLDFLLKLTENEDEIKIKLNNLISRPVNSKKIKQALEWIPANMKIIGKNAHTVLSETIRLINNEHMEQIKNLKASVYSQVIFDSPSKYDVNFDIMFEKWEHKPIDVKHLKKVSDDINTMKIQYHNLQANFNKQVQKLDALQTKIDTDVSYTNDLLDALLGMHSLEQMMKTITTFERIKDRISNHRTQLIQILENLKKILSIYNIERISYAEYLIGMKESLESKRKLMKHKKCELRSCRHCNN